MKTNKNGVSLMTLIITIVIMSILTGTIIISITNSNTIDNAKDAVKRYTLAEVNQFANVAYGEAVMDKLTNTEEILKFIKAELKEYGIDIRYYKIALNGNKVTVANRESEPWNFKKDATGKYEYVTNGDITLNIGDYVNYDETKGGTKTGITNVDWRVLGANEDGDLILISSDNVQTLVLNGGKEVYNIGIDKLNKISREYGYGEGAAYARSITVEDINRITGYNPNNEGIYDPEQTGSGTKYNQGQITEYGNEVTYYWEKHYYPAYEYTTNVGTIEKGECDFHPNGFYYNDIYVPNPSGTLGAIRGQLITTLKSTSYVYGATNYISTTSNAYKVVFKNTQNSEYRGIFWCASSFISTDDGSVGWGLRTVSSGGVHSDCYYRSRSDWGSSPEYAVCPVVILESDIKLDKASDGVWNIM